MHPINSDKHERKNNDRHHTLDGNKLKKVINSKQPTKLNRHIGPAQIGVIKNNSSNDIPYYSNLGRPHMEVEFSGLFTINYFL